MTFGILMWALLRNLKREVLMLLWILARSIDTKIFTDTWKMDRNRISSYKIMLLGLFMQSMENQIKMFKKMSFFKCFSPKSVMLIMEIFLDFLKKSKLLIRSLILCPRLSGKLQDFTLLWTLVRFNHYHICSWDQILWDRFCQDWLNSK